MGHPWVEFLYHGTLSIVSKDFSWFYGFQVPSGWGHLFRVESAVRTRSQFKVFLGMSVWQHVAVPPPLFNVGTRVLYINLSGNVY